jgi:ribosomal protein S18 acetylase RimI-like enzyme
VAGLTDADLYRRGVGTLHASWEAYALGSPGAAVIRSQGVTAAVFPEGPERAFFNNALLERDLSPSGRAAALSAMEGAYASAEISRFAAWVHESDQAMREDLQARGYSLAESTRAMGMALTDIRLPLPRIELAPPDWPEYLRIIGVPPGFARHVDQTAFNVLIAALDGVGVAAGMAFDHGDDCGIYNIATVEPARRRGLGTALTALLAHHAIARGCRTASLQSTPMAEGVYATVGFRDLGRILEYGPPQVRFPVEQSFSPPFPLQLSRNTTRTGIISTASGVAPSLHETVAWRNSNLLYSQRPKLT